MSTSPGATPSPTWRASAGFVLPSGRVKISNFPISNDGSTRSAREAVKRAFAIRIEAASAVDMNDPKVRAILFGQRGQ